MDWTDVPNAGVRNIDIQYYARQVVAMEAHGVPCSKKSFYLFFSK